MSAAPPKVWHSLVWYFAGQAISFVATFIAITGSARLLTPTQVGVFAAASAFVGTLSIFSSFGISSYVVRHLNLDQNALDSAYTINLIISLVLSVVILAASTVAGRVVGSVDASGVIAILSLVPLLAILEFRPSTMLLRDMQFKTSSIITSIRAICSTALILTFAANGFGAYSLALATVCAQSASTLLYNLLAPRHFSLRMSISQWQPITAFGLQMLSITGLASLVNRLSEIALARILGLPALGLYSRASGISTLLFDSIYGGVTKVIFSAMAREQRDHGTVGVTYRLALSVVTATIWPVFFGLAILCQPVTLVLFGSNWLGAALPLGLLMVSQAVAMAFALNLELFVLRDETGRQTKLEAIRAVGGLAAFVAGAMFSLSAAAFGRVVERLIGYVLYRPHLSRLSASSQRELRTIYLQSLVVSVAAVTPALFLMIYTNWSPFVPVSSLAIAIALGILGWVASAFALDHPAKREAVRLIERLKH